MNIAGCPTRNDRVVWQNVGDEVVIAEREGNIIRILNETAAFIWDLADGTTRMEDIIPRVCDRFEVTSEQAMVDVTEFCQELSQAGLISFKNGT